MERLGMTLSPPSHALGTARVAVRNHGAVLLILVSLGWLGIGCTSPCRQLADEICACEFNSVAEAACIQEIEANNNIREPTNEENERCEMLLDTCTCDALEREDFVACGLTNSSRSTLSSSEE